MSCRSAPSPGARLRTGYMRRSDPSESATSEIVHLEISGGFIETDMPVVIVDSIHPIEQISVRSILESRRRRRARVRAATES